MSSTQEANFDLEWYRFIPGITVDEMIEIEMELDEHPNKIYHVDVLDSTPNPDLIATQPYEDPVIITDTDSETVSVCLISDVSDDSHFDPGSGEGDDPVGCPVDLHVHVHVPDVPVTVPVESDDGDSNFDGGAGGGDDPLYLPDIQEEEMRAKNNTSGSMTRKSPFHLQG